MSLKKNIDFFSKKKQKSNKLLNLIPIVLISIVGLITGFIITIKTPKFISRLASNVFQKQNQDQNQLEEFDKEKHQQMIANIDQLTIFEMDREAAATTGWSKYKDMKYKLLFLYPGDWQMNASPSSKDQNYAKLTFKYKAASNEEEEQQENQDNKAINFSLDIVMSNQDIANLEFSSWLQGQAHKTEVAGISSIVYTIEQDTESKNKVYTETYYLERNQHFYLLRFNIEDKKIKANQYQDWQAVLNSIEFFE